MTRGSSDRAEAPAPPPFQRSLAWSAAAHAALFAALWILPRLDWSSPPPFEVEITSSFLGDGPAKLGAPKAFVRNGPANVNADAATPPTNVKKPPQPPQDWTLPGPKTKVLETPVPPAPAPGGAVDGTGTAAALGGLGEGSDEGVPGGIGHGGTRLLALPRLLNRDEVMANLRRFYPESERQAGREGVVTIVIHLGADGAVASSDISRPASPAFDAAAKTVAALMRFSPAIGLNGKPVPVRMPQEVRFRLTD